MKKFTFSMDPQIVDLMKRDAENDRRSCSGQIEWVLQKHLISRGLMTTTTNQEKNNEETPR